MVVEVRSVIIKGSGMLTVISPAKSLDWSEVAIKPTQPAHQEDAVRLAKTARNLTLGGLKNLMSISDDLARLNRDRFKAFAADPKPEQTKPAIFAFNGDTYQGFEAKTLSEDDLAYAQNHLRILSGLYGLLRPLDGIQPYRLEMGSKMKTRRGASLYAYWGDRLAKSLNKLAAEQNAKVLVNCASQEYFGALDVKALNLKVVTPVFMEVKENKPRIVSFFAKKARGAMARYLIENRVTYADGIREFAMGGYTFTPELSDDQKFVFLRDYPA